MLGTARLSTFTQIVSPDSPFHTGSISLSQMGLSILNNAVHVFATRQLYARFAPYRARAAPVGRARARTESARA